LRLRGFAKEGACKDLMVGLFGKKLQAAPCETILLNARPENGDSVKGNPR
jgi:hypothetical protein